VRRRRLKWMRVSRDAEKTHSERVDLKLTVGGWQEVDGYWNSNEMNFRLNRFD
jgi:hypothetical protein